MSSVAVFEFENQNVETVMLDNEPLFNPYEVGTCLGMDNSTVRNHLAEMDEDEKVLLQNSNVRNTDIRKLANRGETFIKESGLYTLMFVSRKPQAKKFKKWVVNEVLPEIRRTGLYNVQKNRLVQNLMANTEALLCIRREEIAILQQESPNKKLSNLMIDCSRNGLGTINELYNGLLDVFDTEIGIDIKEIACDMGLSWRDYLVHKPELCETLCKLAFTHFY